jgi:chromosome segregation ATPase
MTDEELLFWLRVEDTDLTDFAADRIEELSKERDQHWDSFVHWRKEADDRSEQLAAARRDAKIAEEELELQEEEACMMENSYLELKKERDALDAKLAKAVEVLSFASNVDTADWSEALDVRNQARATLAEINGEIP